MKTILLITLASLLSACGGASGGGSAASSSPTSSSPVSNLHTYVMQVTANDPDFTFAPALFGVGANQVSPGPQTVNGIGNTLTYTVTDTQADIQITGISATNGAFHADVVILKDGVQVLSWTIGVGVSQDSGAL